MFFKSKHVARHICSFFQGVCTDFQGICGGFQKFCQDFTGFCLDFHQIKTFGGALAPPAPLPPAPVNTGIIFLPPEILQRLTHSS